MNKKLIWLVAIALVGGLLLVAKPIWQIISGHQYQASAAWLPSNESNTAQVDHSQWQSILDDYLISDDPSGINLFDYDSLADEAMGQLNAYLSSMSETNIRDYSRAEQFAFWVNLYNAVTVKVVADHLPVESIKQISGNAVLKGPWDDPLINVQGQALSLNDIEHRILRPIWKDYRIHFAVNCASIGCPNLQAQAFTSSNSEDLLQASANDYLQHPRGFSVEDNTLTLSSIFDWYQSDFGSTESQMLNTLMNHLNESQRDALIDGDLSIVYDYDWSLNGFAY